MHQNAWMRLVSAFCRSPLRQPTRVATFCSAGTLSTTSGSSGDSEAAAAAAAAAAGNLSSATTTTMRAWQLDKYSGIMGMKLNDVVPLPAMRGTNKLLIEVKASSVNPLDVFRTEGYGTRVIGAMRNISECRLVSNEFPLTLGRDFSGIVRSTSGNVRQFDVGDEVMGFIQPEKQGCHAEYVIASTHCVVKKPKQLSHVEAASLPYVALTAWSSLCFFGGVRRETANGRRALILGASGGVGTFSIQLLKAWGMHVTTVVNGDAVPLVTSLGADCAVDYTQSNWEESLRRMNRFDVIMNCTTNLSSTFAMDCLKVWSNASYVHTMSPLLRNIDAFGWTFGLVNSVAEFGFDAIAGLSNGQWYRWAFIVPSKKALEEIALLVKQQKIRPVVEEVFAFEDAWKAYEKIRQGHARGKTVISLGNDDAEHRTYSSKSDSRSSRWAKLF